MPSEKEKEVVIKKAITEKDIRKAWEEYGYPGLDRLNNILKSENYDVKKKDVKEFLDKQATVQIHKKTNRNKANKPITTTSEHIFYNMDLLDMQAYSKKNEGYKYILVIIDIFTRKLWCEPMKNKTAKETTQVFTKMLDYMPKPKVIMSDEGPEFHGDMDAAMEKDGILHVEAQSGDHNRLGIINRVCQTLKKALHKHFTTTGNQKWVDYLKQFVSSYNKTEHTGLHCQSPNDAEKYIGQAQVLHAEAIEGKKALHKTKAHEFKVGDYARVMMYKDKFKRGYEANYSHEVYQVTEVNGDSITLVNGKTYRPDQILKADKASADVDEAKKVRKEHKKELELKSEDIKQENIVEPKSKEAKRAQVRALLEKTGLRRSSRKKKKV